MGTRRGSKLELQKSKLAAPETEILVSSPRSGVINLARSFRAWDAVDNATKLRQRPLNIASRVADATRGVLQTVPALKDRPKFMWPLIRQRALLNTNNLVYRVVTCAILVTKGSNRD